MHNKFTVWLLRDGINRIGPIDLGSGFARIAHAFGGLSYLSGEADGPPVVPGSTSVADYASGMWGAIGVLAAVRARDNQGIGQFIDLGLYESVFRLLDEIVPAYAKFGYVRERMGADTHDVVPHSHYQTGSGEWVALACTSDKMFERLANVMGKPELAQTYPTSAIRVEHRHTVNGLVADWVGSRSLTDVLKETGTGEVPCAQIYSIKDIFTDPQYAARGNMMTVQDERIGELVLPSPVLKMSETPTVFKHAGRALGADNERVYGELLGLSADQVRQHIDAGVL
jgi:crotonobetainyl-CoA:carnitine CoA-transferase CaiB-like acyl-CoA transferase